MLQEWQRYDLLETLLQDKKHLFLDKLFYNECLLECQLQKGDKQESVKTLQLLQEMNPNDYKYF